LQQHFGDQQAGDQQAGEPQEAEQQAIASPPKPPEPVPVPDPVPENHLNDDDVFDDDDHPVRHGHSHTRTESFMELSRNPSQSRMKVRAERGLRDFDNWENEQISSGHSRTSSAALEQKHVDLARNTAANAQAPEPGPDMELACNTAANAVQAPEPGPESRGILHKELCSHESLSSF
jgi:hypothetical protein